MACLLGLTTPLDGLAVGGGVGDPRRARGWRRGRRTAPSAGLAAGSETRAERGAGSETRAEGVFNGYPSRRALPPG